MELEESWIFGLWPKRLLIFEDRIETHSTELLRETIEARRYEQVHRVTVGDGVWFANLLVGGREGKPILMRGLSKDAARRAKALIEERVDRAGGNSSQPQKLPAARDTADLLRKLADLKDAGVLSQEEFEAKKRRLTAREHEHR